MTRREFGMVTAAVQFPGHTEKRSFIGQTVFEVRPGVLRMIAPWGRPPIEFADAPEYRLPPMIYESRDSGATWQEAGRLKMAWNLTGTISDGGISWIRLTDGRQMLTFHRNVQGFHGGGIPAISFSRDDGTTWSDAVLVTAREQVCYLMNQRTIELRGGRLVIPVALRPEQGASKYIEGGVCWAACFLSDDGGGTWRRGAPVVLDDERGMAEPSVAETEDGRLVMLARTGSGSHHLSRSRDGGETWSVPEPTGLRAACSPLTLVRMPDGGLLVAYNHATASRPGAFFPRTPLCYATSYDGGQTWSDPVAVQCGEGRQWIYPSVHFMGPQTLFTFSEHIDPGDGGFRQRADSWKTGGARWVGRPLPRARAARLPDLPVGLAGHFAGVHNGVLIVAGGTIWTKPRWEGGEKRWVRTIWTFSSGSDRWMEAGEMPAELGYGVSVSMPDGLFGLGGQSAAEASTSILRMRFEDGRVRVETIGSLPEPRTNLGGVAVGEAVYLFGGQAAVDGPAKNQLWRWSSGDWEALQPLPGMGRILPVMTGHRDGPQVLSGAEPGARRRYLRDRWAYDLAGKRWKPLPDLPRAVVAGSSVTTRSGRCLLFSGDDGRLAPEAAQLAAKHPGFSCDVIDVSQGWRPVGAMRCGLVTTAAIVVGDHVVIPGGEDRPGTRSGTVVTIREGDCL